ncbi:MAG: hypothetical protein Q7K29_07750 [Thermoleophilia bacterium]|nr:hypothetical protein [Thermoleophilia bacterium]
MRPGKIFIMVIASLVLCLLASAPAMAQSPCDSVNLVLDPTQGAAGASVMATGGSLMNNTETEFYLDAIDSSNFLGQVLSDSSGDFIFNFNVPDGVTVGVHQVIVSSSFGNESHVECPADFTVLAAVQTDAYTPALAAQGTTPGVLPSTGLILLVPAAGLASAAAGGVLLKRRRK